MDTKIIELEVADFLASDKYKMAQKARKYYAMKTDVLDKRTTTNLYAESEVKAPTKTIAGLGVAPKTEKRGGTFEHSTPAPSRIATSYFRSLVDEKVNYLLSKEFIINSEEKKYNDLLNDTFSLKTRDKIRKLTSESIVSGSAYLHVQFHESGLKFKVVSGDEVFPIYDDITDELLYVVRVFKKKVVKGSKYDIEDCVDIYDHERVYHYLLKNGKLIDDVTREEEDYHLVVGGRPVRLQYIPFVFMKYTEDEMSLLNFVKPAIDSYEATVSKSGEAVEKFLEYLLILFNAGSTDKAEFASILKSLGCQTVNGDGRLEIIKTDLATDELLKHATEMKSLIYISGNGVNYSELQGTNISGVALKMLYQRLDLDSVMIENNLKRCFDVLMYFINLYYEVTGQGVFYDSKYKLQFNKTVITNFVELSDSLINLKEASILSTKTSIQSLGIDIDADTEMELIKQEQGGTEDEL